MSKSYTLDKLHEARDALIVDDRLTCMRALDEVIKRVELIMQTFEMQKELTDGTDTRTERETT